MSKISKPRVVIIGGGFGGLQAAKALSDAPVDVTVIDRSNLHLYQPLLYQVASAALSPGDIAQPIRFILRGQHNTRVLLAEVTALDLPGKKVVLESGDTLPYDYLVVATGARHGYFGHPEWEAFAPGLKSLDDALEIRRRMLFAFEEAERERVLTGKGRHLTFVVVGGGATGVELAGALAEISRKTVRSEFREYDPAETRVLLLEAGPRILSPFDERLASKAKDELMALGVEVRTGAMVTALDKTTVRLGNEVVPATMVLWAAGVAASPLAKLLGAPTDRSGRVEVQKDLSIAGHPEVFAIGDVAAAKDESGRPLPGVAPVAMQGGKHVAECIAADFDKRERKAFHYLDKGSMATIGRAAGIAQIGRLRLSGLLGWLAWVFIHILLLIGLSNRVVVLIKWTVAYFTHRRGTRLITRGDAADRAPNALPTSVSPTTTAPLSKP